VLGLLPYASNATLLTRFCQDDLEGLAVYKPRRGESPLWDFPRGTLCLREYAAWVVDTALGWQLVPPTVLREGPAGFGAVQLFIDVDEGADVRELLRTHLEGMQRMAAFDVVINNADRKAGHCLVDRRGKLWAVDHGVSFHIEPKLRTVVWAFADDRLPTAVLDDLRRLGRELDSRDGGVRRTLGPVLDREEIDALRRRVRDLVAAGRYPSPGPGRHVPWPPW
jgi:hypothetical protein